MFEFAPVMSQHWYKGDKTPYSASEEEGVTWEPRQNLSTVEEIIHRFEVGRWKCPVFAKARHDQRVQRRATMEQQIMAPMIVDRIPDTTEIGTKTSELPTISLPLSTEAAVEEVRRDVTASVTEPINPEASVYSEGCASSWSAQCQQNFVKLSLPSELNRRRWCLNPLLPAHQPSCPQIIPNPNSQTSQYAPLSAFASMSDPPIKCKAWEDWTMNASIRKWTSE